MDLPPFFIKRPYGRVEVTLQVYEEGKDRVCGLRRMEGRIDLPPKALLAAAKQEIATLESIAKEAGCTLMRHVGPGWTHILDGYDPMPGVKHGLQKRL
jgi:hypothetical protein